MHQDLSDGSRERDSQTQLDVSDDKCRSWTPWPTSIRSAGEPRWAWIAGIGDLRKELRGPEVLEAIMAGVVVVVAIAVFLGGIVVGIMAVVAVAVRREDRRYTLAGEAPGRLARGTRRLTGMRRRDLDAEFLRPVGELVH
jgi:hypothetical protein